MCRVLAYLGEPVLLDDFLYKPDNSLVKQTYAPAMLHMLNLAGMGLLAWDRDSHDPGRPFAYHSTALPVFDPNLESLAQKVKAGALLAHVRGVPYSTGAVVGPQNLHPFRYEGCPLAMAHNGDLARFAEMRFDLLAHIRPAIAARIRGTTDSEWIYALLLSQLDDPGRALSGDEIADALGATLSVLGRVRAERGIDTASPVNLFLCDGDHVVATRFTYDYGCYDVAAGADPGRPYLSLWYTTGRDYGLHDGEWRMRHARPTDSVIVASEPLTRDVSTWLEVPEYSLLVVDSARGEVVPRVVALDV